MSRTWKVSARFAVIAALVPGLLLSGTIALSAAFLGEHYTAPPMLFALLLGMAFNFMAADEKCAAGLEFASKQLLRIGVALLGARITIEQLGSLGIGPILLVVLCVPATIGLGLIADRLSGGDGRFGLLTGSAVAICGASAAMAMSAALSPKPSHRDVVFTVVAVTSLSTVAMIVYPVLFSLLGLDDQRIGILIGATIHDVAQVVGAAYAVSDEAGDVATFIKLLRVAMLPVAVLAVSLSARSGSGERKARLPSFMMGFVLLLLLNSVGAIPVAFSTLLVGTSGWLLLAAIASLGVQTSPKALMELGRSRLMLVVGETLFLLGLAVTGVVWLGNS